jgi:hypothetical protein
LIIAGHDSGRLIANGELDKSTQDALKSFQTDNAIEVTGEFDEATVEWMSSREFSMEYEKTDPIKMIQAAMILLGFDSHDELIANGVRDDLTCKLLPFFSAYTAVDAWTFSIKLTETEESATDGCRAKTVDMPPNGEGERNRL